MKRFNDCAMETMTGCRYVLTDIDDTLTVSGRLPAVAYKALERLQSGKYSALIYPRT